MEYLKITTVMFCPDSKSRKGSWKANDDTGCGGCGRIDRCK